MAQQDNNDELGKLFVGGINRQTTEEGLKAYFEQYGEVSDCVLMKDKTTGMSRGFGFVTYVKPQCVAEVLKARPHTIDNKLVDPKPCTPRHIQQQKKVTANQYAKGHKIFIGGISMEASEEDVKTYFERYGVVLEVVFVVNKSDTTKPHKGFGFVTFEDESSVDQACAKHYHMIKDKRVEAKKAESREKLDKSQQNDPNNQGYGNMNQGYNMQGNMGMYQQGGMGQGQNWMGGQMMGNYGYGGQNYSTAYPQQYGNQAYGYGYGGQGYGQGYGGQAYGNMGNMGNMQNMQGNVPQQQQPQQPQQQMGGNMQGYGNMQPNPAMMGGGMPQQGNMQQNNQSNNGAMRGQGDMGAYQQNQSGFGPQKTTGGNYNNMGGGNNMGMKQPDYGNPNQMGGGANTNNSAGGGGSSGGYGPPGKQGGGNSGYHPYRR